MGGRTVLVGIAALVLLPQFSAAQNVAFNKTVWVSSVLGDYTGPLAVDEIFSSTSRWISDTSINHWLVVDLGAVYVEPNTQECDSDHSDLGTV